MSIRVTGVICPNCKDIIISRAQHDFNSCTCGAVSIDGGASYTRMLWREELAPYNCIKFVSFQLPLEANDLYDDWNSGADAFGRFTSESLAEMGVAILDCKVGGV